MMFVNLLHLFLSGFSKHVDKVDVLKVIRQQACYLLPDLSVQKRLSQRQLTPRLWPGQFVSICLVSACLVLSSCSSTPPPTKKPDRVKVKKRPSQPVESGSTTEPSVDENAPSVQIIKTHKKSAKSKVPTDGDEAAAASSQSGRPVSYLGQQVAVFAVGLLETGYTFGGKNPEAGLDCSGLVSYVFRNAVDVKMEGNAATIAKSGMHVSEDELRTGDLVFFNTTGKPYSHVGIYIGNNHFIHAPNSRGKVRIEKLTNTYYKNRFIEARGYFKE